MFIRISTIQDSAWIAEIQTERGLPIWKPSETSWVLKEIEKNGDGENEICSAAQSKNGSDGNGFERGLAFAIWQAAGDECELLSIAVALKFQRQGLGEKLIEFCINELKILGMKKFFLEVREGNKAAISLYRKVGFKEIAVRKKYYSDGENAVVFQLKNS